MPTFIDLFAGIGGISLGLERAGFRCVAHVEIDPYCQRVLRKHWPDVPLFGDITTLDPAELPRADLVAGGFPCQPVSQAGAKRAQADPRWLWPHFARVLRSLRPSVALLENVPSLLTVAGGGAAQEVFGDLADMGFDAEWFVLSAAAVGAPHLRKRVFVVAYADGQRQPKWAQRNGQSEPGIEAPLWHDPVGLRAAVAHAGGPAGRGPGAAGEAVLEPGAEQRPGRRSGSLGEFWATEPELGRVAHGVPNRLDRLRCLGNAVVPQCAEVVGQWILSGGRRQHRLTPNFPEPCEGAQ